MIEINYYIYIMSNKNNTTVYTGITNNLLRRVYEHKNDFIKTSFTSRYKIHKLVYYEVTTDAYVEIQREKQIKAHSRKWKNDLITSMNPEWKDLYIDISG